MVTPNDIKTIELSLINKCVLKCPFCVRQEEISAILKPGIEIKYNYLIKFLDHLKNLEICDLVGSVSEPTLYSHIFDLIKYLKSRNIKIRLSTNGSTFDKEWWAKFGTLFGDNDIIRFPIDGSTQELHSKYRVGSSLEKVLEHHNSFKENSKATTICQYIIFKHNEDDIENMKQFFLKTNFDVLEFTETGYSSNIGKIKPRSEVLKDYKRNFDYCKNVKDYSKITCQFQKEKNIFLNHLGYVLPCDDLDEKTYIENSYSTIYTEDYEKIFKDINNMPLKFEECCLTCGSFNQHLRKKYPIIQYNKKLEKRILKTYRENSFIEEE